MAFTFRPYKIPSYADINKGLRQKYKIGAYESKLSSAESSYLKQLMALPGQRKSVREAEYKKYGIPGLETEYSGIRRDIQGREAQYEQQQGKITDKPLSMAAITGQEAALSRNKAIEMNSLYTKRDVISGDLERARGYAKEAIDYAIEDEMAKIAAFEQRVNIRQNQLGRATDKYQNELTYKLDVSKAKLASNIALKEMTANLWVELQKEYPRARLTGRMTPEQMFAAVKPFASQREKLELDQQRAQVAQMRAATAASNRSGSGNVDTGYGRTTFKDANGNVYLLDKNTGKKILLSKGDSGSGGGLGSAKAKKSWFDKAANSLKKTVKTSPGYRFLQNLFR